MGESPAASPAKVAKAPKKSPKKSPKKRKAGKPKKTGPTVGDLIIKVLVASKERKGVSLAALKKALKAGGYNAEKNKGRIRVAVKSLVTKGTLVHTKGTGASGSFKLSKKPTKPTKKAGSKRKSPAKKKPKAKKARKSPKKAKRPAAKKGKSPKKAKKRTAAKKIRAKTPRKAKPVKRRVSKGKKRAAAKKK